MSHTEEKEPELNPELERRRARGERVVFTNGCFDILHVGHLRYLAEARQLGDCLVVGLNSDDSVRALSKGINRPILPEAERKELLLGLRAVDFVEIFSEETPLELIKRVRPHVLVKGGDWPVETIVGAEFVKSYGGDVRCLSFIEGQSTTNIIRRIKDS